MNPNDPMLEVYIYENVQLLEQLEEVLLTAERDSSYSSEQIDVIFRIMHTIKGSSAMMNFDTLAHVAHSVEDMFANIREKRPKNLDNEKITDIVLGASDFFKAEMAQIQAGIAPVAEPTELTAQVEEFLAGLTGVERPQKPAAETIERDSEEEDEPQDEPQYDIVDVPGRFFKIQTIFEPDSKMENVRAFGIVTDLGQISSKMAHIPADLFTDTAERAIIDNGFSLFIKTDQPMDVVKQRMEFTLFVQSFDVIPLEPDDEQIPRAIRETVDYSDTEKEIPEKPVQKAAEKPVEKPADKPISTLAAKPSSPKPATQSAKPVKPPLSTNQVVNDSVVKQNFISVNLSKLDSLLNIVGEIVMYEAMVIKSQDLVGLRLENFEKAANMLRKTTSDLQDLVMSVRMVPISATFHKMNRIVRDMSKKIGKEAELIIIGEETEVDKNILDNLSDPLMHLIRNSMDHGLETPEVREAAGKPTMGRITLEARNTGGDVLILVSDDGKGMDKHALYLKAFEKGLTTKAESEVSDKEAYMFTLMPGFSTKEQVTEFSGRGVGMDVVHKNIEKVGGSISIDSTLGKGTTTIIKIPLTLAIVDGLAISVGTSNFIVPIMSIRQTFKAEQKDIVNDPEGNEMIMIRGECYPIVRLHKVFSTDSGATSLMDGIMLLIESDTVPYCMFADKLIGEQQAVLKPMPPYITRQIGHVHGIGGCTILGDGSISLIINVNDLAEAG